MARSGSSFTVNNPFTSGAAQIQVLTASKTKFENVSGVSALNVGATVSLEGLLFNNSGNPALVAKRVRSRETIRSLLRRTVDNS